MVANRSGWKFGTPHKGQEVVSYRDVRVQRAGRTWTASYHLTDDGQLVISSAWGSRKAPDPGIKKRADKAQAMLAGMVDDRIAHG
jgi:hypothetical protein